MYCGPDCCDPSESLSLTICFQSGLLELSGLSADLDVLNTLSCSLTVGDAAARRLQRLNHRWADASARAEEACRSAGEQICASMNTEQQSTFILSTV